VALSLGSKFLKTFNTGQTTWHGLAIVLPTMARSRAHDIEARSPDAETLDTLPRVGGF